MTAKQVALSLGLSDAAVSRRMSGAVAWNIDELNAVATLLDVEVHDLMTDQGALAARNAGRDELQSITR